MGVGLVNVAPTAAAVWDERTWRSRVTLRKMLVQLSELFLFVVALECQICAVLAKVQPAQPPSRMSSAFPNAGRAVKGIKGRKPYRPRFK